MKLIRYNLCTRVDCGTEEKPSWNDVLYPVEMPWSESNEAIAKSEAYNGKYTIEDDGQGEPEAPITLENRVSDLETNTADLAEALDMILSGVTE